MELIFDFEFSHPMLEKMQSLANPLKLSAVPRGRIIYWWTILWEKERLETVQR
jgi:hypothetical protein